MKYSWFIHKPTWRKVYRSNGSSEVVLDRFPESQPRGELLSGFDSGSDSLTVITAQPYELLMSNLPKQLKQPIE